MAKNGNESCPICCNVYTSKVRKCIACLHCEKSACKECWETYLPTVAVQQPRCMHCNAPWNDEFIANNFSKAFREGPMKRAREDRLIGIEEAMLPGTQRAARLTRMVEEETQRKRDYNDRIKFLLTTDPTGDHGHHRSKRTPTEHEIAVLRVHINVTTRALRDMRTALAGSNAAIDEYFEGLGGIRMHRNEETAKNPPQAKGFMHKCPGHECNGFLSAKTQKCGICNIKVCKDCLEPETNNGEKHVCNPSILASIKTLMQDTKPCPKCGMGIHKISGCYQMWCTQCKTAFHWVTGTIETGVLHNPHWYEWQRLQGQQRPQEGRQRRDMDNVPIGGCIQRRAYPDFEIIRDARGNKLPVAAGRAHRAIVHIQEVLMPRLQGGGIDDSRNRDLRVSYLLGKIDKENWKKQLFIRDKKRQLDESLRQILDTFIMIAGGILWQLCEQANFESKAASTQLKDIRAYTNTCLSRTMARFNSKRIIRIDDGFNVQEVA